MHVKLSMKKIVFEQNGVQRPMFAPVSQSSKGKVRTFYCFRLSNKISCEFKLYVSIYMHMHLVAQNDDYAIYY